MATGIDGNERRRIILRRGRGGGGGGSSFGGGGTGRVESLRETAAEADEVDDAIDPDQQVRARMALPPPMSPEQGREDPRGRIQQFAAAGSPQAAKEHRLTMVNRMLMRNVALDQIARSLGVSVSTVERDRAELRKMLREQARSLNIEELVGTQNAFYDEIQGMALRVASAGANPDGTGGVPVAMKLASMRTALAANADRTRFLNTAGVFDVLRFKPPEESGQLSEVQTLMERTLQMMQSLDDPEPEEEQPRRRAAVRRTRPGGFSKMSFDDADASGSSNEVQEL